MCPFCVRELDVLAQDALEMLPRDDQQPRRHSRRTLPTHRSACAFASGTVVLENLPRQGDARFRGTATMGITASSTRESPMKLRLMRIAYFLALAVAFAVAAGADRKFGG
jgi:hypothetical protein